MVEETSETAGTGGVAGRVAPGVTPGDAAGAAGAVRRSGRGAAVAGVAAAWWERGAYVALLAAALGMRLWDLGSRAMHHDESLHAYYSWLLSTGAGYRHDPMMHGPFQFEANAAILLVLGDSDVTARLLYAVAGTILVGVPYLLRGWLGRWGALAAAGMLAFSPTMLYFSRFARNDIITAVWTLGLVVCIWRYIGEGRNRYLYALSALLALFFATKENAYIATAVLGLYLLGAVVVARSATIRDGAAAGGAPLWRRAARAAMETVVRSRRAGWPADGSRAADLLVVMASLTLPLGAALAGLLQDTPLLRWSGLVLARPAAAGGPIGAPVGGGLVIAAAIVIALLWASVSLGSKWQWPVWWRCALVFCVIWVPMYTTFFTHPGGAASGVWQSLGYWVAQQDVARGGQPWYYYFVLLPVYEFLPLALALAGGVYYLRRGDRFGRFLAYWAAATLLAYMLASEKMPWLLVSVTLPLILLAGKFAADVTRGIAWRRFVSGGGPFLLPGVPLALAVLWRLAFADLSGAGAADVARVALLAGALVALAASGVVIGRAVGFKDLAAFSVLPVGLVLLALTVRTGLRAAYENGDRPVEMIVYTQTSPDIPLLLREIERVDAVGGGGKDTTITIDATSGFSWPWAWYLRHFTRVGYPSLEGSPAAPDASVVVVHSRNREAVEAILGEGYGTGVRVRHRWWFPEQVYKDLTVGKFLRSFGDRQAWRRAMDYFLYRRLETGLGSEDSYVYFSRETSGSFAPPP